MAAELENMLIGAIMGSSHCNLFLLKNCGFRGMSLCLIIQDAAGGQVKIILITNNPRRNIKTRFLSTVSNLTWNKQHVCFIQMLEDQQAILLGIREYVSLDPTLLGLGQGSHLVVEYNATISPHAFPPFGWGSCPYKKWHVCVIYREA